MFFGEAAVAVVAEGIDGVDGGSGGLDVVPGVAEFLQLDGAGGGVVTGIED